MSELKHTPTPWDYKPSKQPNGPEHSWDCAILDGNREIIAETFGIVNKGEQRPSLQNAQFIVKACNNYEVMRDALIVIEGLLTWIKKNQKYMEIVKDVDYELSLCREALNHD